MKASGERKTLTNSFTKLRRRKMKCDECGMGFILAPVNVDRVCPHCGYAHGPKEKQQEPRTWWQKIIDFVIGK